MRRSGLIVIAILAALVCGEVVAQCAQPVIINQSDQRLPPPAGGFDSVFVFNLATNTTIATLTMNAGALVADQFTLLGLEAAKAVPDPSQVVLQWRKTSDGSICNQPYTLGDQGVTMTEDSDPAAIYAACESTVQQQSAEVIKRVGTDAYERGTYTLLVMHPKIGLCYTSRQFGIHGEPIVTGIYTNSTFAIPRLRLDPCSPRPSAPNVLAPSAGITAPRAQTDTPKLFIVRSDVCYNDSVTVTFTTQPPGVNGAAATETSVSHVLQQYPRYHATLQMGAIFTDNQQRIFGLRPGQNNTTVIADEGPVDEGPEYYAALMIYGIPHYVKDLFGGQRYDGRELTTERGWLDRTSLVLGAGLNKPAERIGAGLSYEILPGVNIVGMYERAKINHLNGINVGDTFAGTKETIPMKKSWDEQFVFGIGIDGRYAIAIFTGK